MAITLVQTATIASTSSGASQQTGAFAANPTVGNYIIAYSWGWVSSTHNQTAGFSDTGGNTYTIPTNAYQNIAVDLWMQIGFAKITTSAASFKVTSTSPAAAGASEISIVAAEFSGIVSTSPLYGAAIGTNSSTASQSYAPGSLAIPAASIVASVVAFDDGGTSSVINTPAGYTSLGRQVNGATFQVGEAIYCINHSTPSNPTWTTTDAASKWASSQFALSAVSVAVSQQGAALLLMQM